MMRVRGPSARRLHLIGLSRIKEPMRILLVQPPKAPATIGGEDVFIYEPLALEYLAAAVAANHDVRILDLRLHENLQDVLQQYRPDLVGITAYTVHVNVAR